MTRVLACLALGAWVLLLWPFPITTFMATCMACVTYPAYRRLHRRLSPSWAMTAYTVGLAAITILPLATVVSLVTPQAVAGLKILDCVIPAGYIALRRRRGSHPWTRGSRTCPDWKAGWTSSPAPPPDWPGPRPAPCSRAA